MSNKRNARTARHSIAAPSSMQGYFPTRAPNSAFNTGFREWLRKITATTDDGTLLAIEHLRLEQIRKMMGDVLAPYVSDMSARDLRIYLRIALASRLDNVREVRFECFDLMCRKISEPVAVRQLQRLDQLIA